MGINQSLETEDKISVLNLQLEKILREDIQTKRQMNLDRKMKTSEQKILELKMKLMKINQTPY